MQFTIEVRNAVLAYLAGDGPTPKGQACRFIPMDGFGVKLYGRHEEGARYAYDTQAKAAEHDVAPKVGDFFSIRLRLGPREEFTVYGYLTEMAQNIGHLPDMGDGSSCYDSPFYRDACRRIEALGFPTGDMHSQNFGWIGNRLVMIDFDEVSLSVN